MTSTLPLTLSYEILNFKDNPCKDGFFNIYVKCNEYIITKMTFFHEPKYIEILDNIKKNISKMKRGVSMDVKKGLSIDNINFKYLSSQRMSKNEEEHTYNEDISNRGTFEISLNHHEDNFFHVIIPFTPSIINVFENFIKWIERRNE
jgi:hypothetical protein